MDPGSIFVLSRDEKGVTVRTPVSRRIGSVVGLAALVVVSCPSGVGAASTFTAVAGGDLLRFSISPDPPIFVEYPVDLGGVVAGARLDSLGSSTAYASTPFPGDATVQMPGLMAGVTAGAVNLPEYPLYANSDYPSAPERDAQAGSLTLQASSGPSSSRSLVQDGANRSSVEVSVNPVDDLVSGRAEVNLGYVDLGPLLSIDGLRSTASAARPPQGDLLRASELRIGTLTVLGRPLEVPADQLPAIESQPLIAELAKQGVQLSYLAPVETEHGVISAGLLVSWLAPVPNYGQARITAQMGRTFASVTNQPVADDLLGAPTEPVPVSATPAPAGDSPAPPADAPTFSPPDATPTADERVAAAAPRPASAAFAPLGTRRPMPALAFPPPDETAISPPAPLTAPQSAAPSAASPESSGAGGRDEQALTTALAAVDRTPISRLGGLLALAGLAVLVTGALFRRYGLGRP